MQSDTIERRSQLCARCGRWMFDYYRSPDGHFGLVRGAWRDAAPAEPEVRCLACGARYRLLDRLSPLGQPVIRL